MLMEDLVDNRCRVKCGSRLVDRRELRDHEGKDQKDKKDQEEKAQEG